MSEIEFYTLPISVDQRETLGRVGVLFGGNSAEREISLQSGAAVLDALQTAGVNAVPVEVNNNAVDQIREANIDRAFIALHGVGGEDGRIQSLLSFFSIPFTGSGVQASAIAMDKLLSKQLWRGVGLSTPNFSVLNDDSDWSLEIEQLGGSAMVKPSHEGSSLGMSFVQSAQELENAYQTAKQYDTSVIAEQFIIGAEYTVAILNGIALPPIKLETDHTFYDYDAKYLANDTRYVCPCGLDSEQEESLKSLAVSAYQSVNCSGWARVDVMADRNGNFYLLEINTVPGMTSHSLVPMAAKQAGLSFEQLVLNILAGARA
ncbi:D-alanine--D-alanine ligase [Aurantivibrio plasticivorans]